MMLEENKNKNYLLVGAVMIILALFFGVWTFLMKPKPGPPTAEEKKSLRQSYLPGKNAVITELSDSEKKAMMPKAGAVVKELSKEEREGLMPLAGSEVTSLIGD